MSRVGLADSYMYSRGAEFFRFNWILSKVCSELWKYGCITYAIVKKELINGRLKRLKRLKNAMVTLPVLVRAKKEMKHRLKLLKKIILLWILV